MTKTEAQRLSDITAVANELLNASGPTVSPNITNMDIMEAMLGDIELVKSGRAPKHLAALATRDNDSRGYQGQMDGEQYC